MLIEPADGNLARGIVFGDIVPQTFPQRADRKEVFGTTVTHNGYMQYDPIPKTDWWHERPTKAAELDTAYRTLSGARAKRDAVWKKCALVVGLMFAFILSLVSMMSR